MIYLLDTNIFARTVIREEAKITRECESILEKTRQGLLETVTLDLVFAEVGWLLKSYYKLPRETVADALGGLVRTKGLEIKGEADFSLALEYYRKFNVKLTDALIASVPEVVSKKWTVVSYDEDFKKLPVKWMKPGEVK